jgi:two-component system sensor histidine kinase BarA
VLASVGTAVILIAGVSAWRDGRRDATMRADQLSSTAAVVASLTAEPAWKHDTAGAFAAVRSIGLMRGVVYARVEDASGRLLAETGSGARLVGDARLGKDSGTGLWSILHSSTIQAVAPIVYARRPVGRVVLVGDAGNGFGRLLTSLLISLIAAIVAGAVGLAISWRLQKAISDPIVTLTTAMGAVRLRHDYGGSVAVKADGELGELVDGFNTMLNEVHKRDLSIAAHLASLEETVKDRTAELVVAKDAAESANAAKSDFLATMSHEIRTPMNGIMVMAEMLAGGELPKRQRRFAEVIAKSGSSLLAIINDILDFSKIEAGKMELEQMPVDVAEVAEDVCALFWERARSKGLDLAAYVDPGVPYHIASDPVRLRQVVGNLVNNAIKFTENGGVFIRVSHSDQGLTIAVNDSGIGIAKEKLASVFGAFSQADQTTTRKYGGTGLGLAISKRLVEAMGGEISVRSELDRGSTFAFRVPCEVLEAAKPWPRFSGTESIRLGDFGPATRAALTQYLSASGIVATPMQGPEEGSAIIADAASLQRLGCKKAPTVCIGEYGDSLPSDLKRAELADILLVQPFRRQDLREVLDQLSKGEPLSDKRDAATDNGLADMPYFGGCRVLVADDSAVNREVAIEALSRLGISCEVCEDGRQAVEAARRGGMDLILMDGSMPEMDGYEASKAIRLDEAKANAPRLPIIALTAHVLGAAAEAWRDAEMDAVLHKPFTLKALGAVLGQFLTASAPPEVIEPAAVNAPPLVLGPVADPVVSALLDPVVTRELELMASDGKADFVERVRQLYRDNAPVAVMRVIDAATADDAPGVALAAHALKSMSLNIGAKAVAELSAVMEREARDHGRVRVSDAQQLHAHLLSTLDVLGAASAPQAALTPEDALGQDLEGAADRGEFSLLYQPQVDRAGEKLVGVEVLLRWHHPKRGFVSPALFIPLAERRDMMRPITRWVVEETMRQTAHLSPLVVSFNASAVEFADPTFADEMAVLIARQRFDPARLEVEITETAILSDADEVLRNMHRLHELGLRIALDDFGVGHSSLSHLRLFPFDKLKIDKVFIDDCCTDVQSATLVHAVVSIGRALGMKVVAEGIENDQQHKFLKATGVHAFQGFLFGKPMTLTDLQAAYKLQKSAEAA